MRSSVAPAGRSSSGRKDCGADAARSVSSSRRGRIRIRTRLRTSPLRFRARFSGLRAYRLAAAHVAPTAPAVAPLSPALRRSRCPDSAGLSTPAHPRSQAVAAVEGGAEWTDRGAAAGGVGAMGGLTDGHGGNRRPAEEAGTVEPIEMLELLRLWNAARDGCRRARARSGPAPGRSHELRPVLVVVAEEQPLQPPDHAIHVSRTNRSSAAPCQRDRRRDSMIGLSMGRSSWSRCTHGPGTGGRGTEYPSQLGLVQDLGQRRGLHRGIRSMRYPCQASTSRACSMSGISG